MKPRSSLWQRLDQLADEDAAGDKQGSIERETIRRQLKELEEPSTMLAGARRAFDTFRTRVMGRRQKARAV